MIHPGFETLYADDVVETSSHLGRRSSLKLRPNTNNTLSLGWVGCAATVV